jgi:hypothetical protein
MLGICSMFAMAVFFADLFGASGRRFEVFRSNRQIAMTTQLGLVKKIDNMVWIT